jgi:hypothetical protein
MNSTTFVAHLVVAELVVVHAHDEGVADRLDRRGIGFADYGRAVELLVAPWVPHHLEELMRRRVDAPRHRDDERVGQVVGFGNEARLAMRRRPGAGRSSIAPLTVQHRVHPIESVVGRQVPQATVTPSLRNEYRCSGG